MSTQRIALIPAYEPGEELLPLLQELTDEGFACVVVDDGSGPAYAARFAKAGQLAALLSYEPNRGKGYALRAGLSLIAERFAPDSVVVTLDSDGQHTVPDAKRVAEAATARPDALTLGVRSFGEGTPARSQFGNSVTRFVYHLSTGVRVSDTQTGLRAFGMALIPQLLAIRGDRYEYEMNMLLDLPEKGVPIREVPIATVYLNGNKGSHFHTFRDSWLVYGRFLSFAASSFSSFLLDYGLYSLLVWLLAGRLGSALAIPLCNVTARVVSAGANFTVNKLFVFHSRGSTLKTGAQYVLLAACILAGNTLLLSFLVNGLGLNKYAAKLITELTFFTLSFLGQRFWIFRKKTPRVS